MSYLKSLNAQSLGVLGVVLLAAVFMFVPDMALAASNNSGGLGTVQGQVTNIMDTILLIITGVVVTGAIIAIVFLCFQGLTGRKDWSELIAALGWSICIGLATPFVTWLIHTAASTKFS
ncbi:MAG: TrbC/VirB2 family protein [Neisseriaceae bacterium]|nr:TrbC/VirB2 family protein [Neisseriaceae bacterium]